MSLPTLDENRFQNSRALLERARRSLTGGVSSPFRAKFPVPLYFREGRGSRLIDEDGNEYIDYTLAWGPAILGHCHPRMVEAMTARAPGPFIYGAQHRAEIDVAEKIQAAVPCAERVAFTSSGSEAVQLALRLARAYTGRTLVLKFEGHYHGWLDSVLLSHHPEAGQVGPSEEPRVVPESRGQVANAADNVAVLTWNDSTAVERLLSRRPGEIAAVIMEPVLCNSGCILPAEGYLESVAASARKHGALLVFDEIITGFRMGLSGAQGHYGVVPDLATFGKAVAGGLPLSVVAGRREIMEQMGQGVSFGGTFNGNPVSLCAAAAVLEELARDEGAALKRANRLGKELMAGISALAQARGVSWLATGFGAALALHFTERTQLREYRDTLEDDRGKLSLFARLALEEGIYFLPDGRFYVSAAHTEQDVDATLAALGRALDRLESA